MANGLTGLLGRAFNRSAPPEVAGPQLPPELQQPGLLSRAGKFIGSDKGQQISSGLLGISQALAQQRMAGQQGVRPSLGGAIGGAGRGFAAGAGQARAEQAAARAKGIDTAIKLKKLDIEAGKGNPNAKLSQAITDEIILAGFDDPFTAPLEAKQTAAAKVRGFGQSLTDKEKIQVASDMEKQYIAGTKDFKKQVDGYGRMLSISKDVLADRSVKPTGGQSLALVFNFMKTLDPGSVVRESEFRSAAAARAALTRLEEDGVVIPTWFAQKMNQLTTGGFLVRDQFVDFVTQAKRMVQDATDRNDVSIERYRRKANNRNVSDVFGISDYGAADLLAFDVAGGTDKGADVQAPDLRPGTEVDEGDTTIPEGTEGRDKTTGKLKVFRDGEWVLK